MKNIDLPPLWLLGFIVAAWGIGQVDPFELSLKFAITDLISGLLVGAGIVLSVLAVIEMRKKRTTFIPHREAEALVTSGIFKRSRNPIYFGDMLILIGAILWMDVPLALPLIPIFVWLIEKRFILPEEDHLRRKFRVQWARYIEKTRRWI